jgi:hypothetical protein
MEEGLRNDAKALEDAFFKKENDRLIRELRAKAEQEQKRKALREMMPKADDSLLSHLVDLGVGPSTALAIGTVPLVAVAWADGKLDAREREAILKAARQRGIEPGSPNHVMLELWLSERPGTALLEAWKHYIAGIWPQLTAPERKEVREALLDRARSIAKAAGGFLGMASISPEEESVLTELAAHLPL